MRSAHREHHRTHRYGWLRAAVLGANDGIVSVASLILGLTLLQEQIHDDALGLAGSIAALLVTFAGMAVLATRDAGPEADTEPKGA